MKSSMKEILNSAVLKAKALKIKYFFSDVDGSLTDGCIYYSAKGEEMKKFSYIDGTGFLLLRKAGILVGIITGENSEIVSRRAEKLQLDYCYNGAIDKFEIMRKFVSNNRCKLDEIAYIGDDLNDLALIEKVGLSFAPANAHLLVKEKVDICCQKEGGNGAFREAVETFLVLTDLSITG
jgi:YrbI family 3-deoxy-D-manno-octulosonate 8-phosphate phosphatase